MKSVKDYFKNRLSQGDDIENPQTSIESIEREQERQRRRNKKKDRPPTLRDIPKLTKELLYEPERKSKHHHNNRNKISSSSNSTNSGQSSSEFASASSFSSQSDIVDNYVGINAANKLYELCDVGHKNNREPMVASGKYDVLGPLTQCLLHESIATCIQREIPNNNIDKSNNNSSPLSKEPNKKTNDDDNNADGKNKDNNNNDTTNNYHWLNGNNNTENISSSSRKVENDNNEDEKNTTTKNSKRRICYQKDEKLHFVCLTLNNLSIPHENKKVMVKERGAKKLIGNLCKVIASGKKEAYLCCIILMNLSFYEPGLAIIGQFSPSPPAQQQNNNNQILNNSSTSNDDIDNNNDNNSGNNNAGKAAMAALTNTAVVSANAVKSTAVTTKRVLVRAVGKQPKLTPLENPYSLLRILQDLISNVERGTSDFRWAFGLLANLSRYPENALLIGLTGIPRVAIDNLKVSKLPPASWKTNSLEDFSLYFLLHLSESCPPNMLKGAADVIIPIMHCENDHNRNCSSNNNANSKDQQQQEEQQSSCENKTDDGSSTAINDYYSKTDGNNNRNHNRGGIQSLKATMTCAFLGVDWDRFPDHGVIAAGSVSELMANTFERVGKKNIYTDNDFSLRTAVAAYAALAKAASKADAKVTTTTTAAKTATMINTDDDDAANSTKSDNNDNQEGTDNTVGDTVESDITASAAAESTKESPINETKGNDDNADTAASSNDDEVAANTAAVAAAEDNESASTRGDPTADNDISSTDADRGGDDTDDKSQPNSENDDDNDNGVASKVATNAEDDNDTTTTTNPMSSDTASDTAITVTKAIVDADNNKTTNGPSSTNNVLTNATATSATTVATRTSATVTTSSSCVNTKVIALPTSVALLFQIINAIALHWGDEDDKNYETYHWDMKAGNLAVMAIMSLLPALLDGEKQRYPQQNNQTQTASLGTQQACADLSKIFVFFSKNTNSISVRARAMEIAEKLTESSAEGTSLPLLQAAYDLSLISFTHRIKKNFL